MTYPRNPIIYNGAEALICIQRDGKPSVFVKIDADDAPAAGMIRWNWSSAGYAVHSSRNKEHRASLHRMLMRPAAGYTVDHINRDTSDNRRINLRVITLAQNNQNLSVQRHSMSGVRGVSWIKEQQKWRAGAKHGGMFFNLGYFNTIEEAELVVRAWRARHMPFSEDGDEIEREPPVLSGPRRGEDRPGSKLTETSVREIRRRRLMGEEGPALAREFGVGAATIYSVCSGKKWACVT